MDPLTGAASGPVRLLRVYVRFTPDSVAKLRPRKNRATSIRRHASVVSISLLRFNAGQIVSQQYPPGCGRSGWWCRWSGCVKVCRTPAGQVRGTAPATTGVRQPFTTTDSPAACLALAQSNRLKSCAAPGCTRSRKWTSRCRIPLVPIPITVRRN